MSRRYLSQAEARRFYDRFGPKQDSQSFYEAKALATLVRFARLPEARRLVELGCGTGRFARELLDRHLPPSARYCGLDLSATMTELAQRRLRTARQPALVVQAAVLEGLPFADGAFDRVVSTYVLDLLSAEAIVSLLGEARRILAPGGLLCLTGITAGSGPLSRTVMALWSLVHRLSPAVVGGCRPVRVDVFLTPAQWAVEQREVVVGFGVASEVLVARRV